MLKHLLLSNQDSEIQYEQRLKNNKWGITHSDLWVCQEKASCESTPATSARAASELHWGLGSFRITRPQISASIPSETDYPGLSQTQRIITGSPLGHYSLHAPLNGNTQLSGTPEKTGREHRLHTHTGIKLRTNNFSYFVSLVAAVYVCLRSSHYSSHISLLICYIRSVSLSQTCSQSQLSRLPPPLALFHVLPFSSSLPSLPFTFVSHLLCQRYLSP